MRSCSLCRSEAFPRFSLSHAVIWQCKSSKCGLRFAFPQLDDERLRAAYSRFYYPGLGGGPAHYENTSDAILRQVLRRIDEKLGGLAGKDVLDYGCGTGSLCRLALEKGALPVGIEAVPDARDSIRRTGLFCVYESLHRLQEDRGDSRFDFIFLWQVIEHLREPWRELGDLAALLKPGARILISTPNASGLKARLRPSRWDNYLNPTHFYYFAPRSLRLVLERAGFDEITQLRFSIRYPHHSSFRFAFHKALLCSRLDGELLFTAKPKPRECASGTVLNENSVCA